MSTERHLYDEQKLKEIEAMGWDDTIPSKAWTVIQELVDEVRRLKALAWQQQHHHNMANIMLEDSK